MSIKFNFLSLVLGGFSKAAAKLQKNSDSRNSLYLFFAKIQANKYKLYLLHMIKRKSTPQKIACIFFLQKFKQIHTSYPWAIFNDRNRLRPLEVSL